MWFGFLANKGARACYRWKISFFHYSLIFGPDIHTLVCCILFTLNLPLMIKITEKAIDVQKVIDTASSLAAGAVDVFIGTVRNSAHGKNVLWLEYEAYESMAVAEIRKITDEASRRWPVLGFGVSHRIGTLKPGEVSVVVAVSTPHRRDSFEACQYIIDNIKEKAPIWKKEVFEDGEEWISASPVNSVAEVHH